MTRFLAIAIAIAALASLPATVRADTQNCTSITTLPAVISAPGVYCLKQDLSTSITSGAAIDITAGNVTLDCNEHKIGGLSAGAGTQAVGISALQRNNITVRHCNVRGFWIGIALSHGGVVPIGQIVEDNRLDNNTRVGIYVGGDASVVRRNIVTHTGGNTTYDNAIGIETHYAVDILDNTIDDVFEDFGNQMTLIPYGILVWTNRGGVIQGNRVRNIYGVNASPVGILLTNDSVGVTLRDNHVRNPEGVFGDSISCVNIHNLALGNSRVGFGTDITGCANGGGNVHN